MSEFIEGQKAVEAESLKILADRDSLHRKVEASDGTVICECDGTSRAIRGCLSGLRALEKEKFDSGVSKRTPHMRFVRACVNQGILRIEEKI